MFMLGKSVVKYPNRDRILYIYIYIYINVFVLFLLLCLSLYIQTHDASVVLMGSASWLSAPEHKPINEEGTGNGVGGWMLGYGCNFAASIEITILVSVASTSFVILFWCCLCCWCDRSCCCLGRVCGARRVEGWIGLCDVYAHGHTGSRTEQL